MLTYNCSVCQGCYDSGPAWLLHLLHEEHQKLARVELPQWGKEERSRGLVIFAGVAVGEDVRVIEKLSRDGGGGTLGSLVTDLVWWERRPEVGFVQFESRENVLRVLATLQDGQFPETIGEPVVWCVMDGETITDVDWLALLSECVGPRGEKRTRGGGVLDGEVLDPEQNVKLERIDPDPDSEEEFQTAEESTSSPISQPGSLDEFLQEGPGLHQHLISIRKLIEIPDRDYNTALEFAHCLQEALVNVRKDGDPELKVVLNRHWNLKLKYALGDEKVENAGCALVVCIYRGGSGVNVKLVEVIKNVRRIFDPEDASQHFPHYEVTEDPNLGMGTASRKHRNQCYRFVHRDAPDDPFWMSLVFKPGFPAESQIYNLVRHLCRFDPHCYPVLSLTFYWANINSIIVGTSYKDGGVKELGDPCALSWLLIYFFQMEGLVPSTSLVLERPHEPLFNGKRDVGFAGHDTTWWRGSKNGEETTPNYDGGDELFAKEVFTLLYKFFLFCDAHLGGGSGEDLDWILNTRDSEKLSMTDILAGKVIDSKLAPHELRDIRKGLELDRGNGKTDKLVMLQPFFIDWERKISCENAGVAFPAMKETGLKLKEYLRGDDINVKREKLDLEEFLNLLKF